MHPQKKLDDYKQFRQQYVLDEIAHACSVSRIVTQYIIVDSRANALRGTSRNNSMMHSGLRGADFSN